MRVRIVRVDNFSLRDIGKAIKDVTKVSLAPATAVVNKVKGKSNASLGLETGLGKSLEKSGVGKVAADTVRLGVAPITNATASILNKPINNEYATGAGKVVGKLHDMGNQGVNIVAKSFADTVSGGLASKGKNWIAEKVDPKGKLGYKKQSAYKYGEETPTQSSGIKILDKAAGYIPITSKIVGTTAGIYSSASGAGSLVAGLGGMAANKLQQRELDKSNIKPTNVQVGENVLKKQLPIVTDSEMKPKDYQVPFPAGVQVGDVPGAYVKTSMPQANNNAMASFGALDFKNPYVIGGIVILIVLMLVVGKSKQ